MKELYKRYVNKFEKAKAVAEKYGLSTEKMDNAVKEIEDFKVTAPLVGGFSTGKSTLINVVLGEEILSTEITPETAVPAEICYGQNSVLYVTDKGTSIGKVSELNTKKLSIDKEKLVQITLDNDFLKTIPSVKIVDMPGFDSGFEVHNRAIDEYLPKSLAYIIAVSADEGTIRESVLAFLSELKLSKMPVYLVITKTDKIALEEINDVVAHIKSTAEKRLGISDIKTAVTSADDENAEEFKDILQEIEKRSDEVFKTHYSDILSGVLYDIKAYLQKRLKTKDMSEEELENTIRNLEDSILNMREKIEHEKQKFDKQCEQVISSIESKVQSALSSSASMLENMLYNGNDIGSKVNSIVRVAITEEISTVFEPKIKKYAENISSIIENSVQTADTSAVLLSADIKAQNDEMRNLAQNLVTPLTTIATTFLASSSFVASIAGTIGLSSTILGPVGAVIGLVIGGLITHGMHKREEAQKREAAREKVRQVINQVSSSVGSSISQTVYKIRDNVNESIEKEMEEKIAIQQKSLADAKEKMKLNQQEKMNEINEISSDLQSIEKMITEEKI